MRLSERTRLALKFAQLCVLLYLFLISLELMKSGFKLFGADFQKQLMQTTSNPLVGLCIGLLATSIVQSSSSTTSMMVAMVSGGLLDLRNAIPMVMGANIGTSVTNLLVASAHITRKNEFERAFTAATVHDVFNLLSVALMLPLELTTHFLERSATFLSGSFERMGGVKMLDPVGAAVEPAAHLIKRVVFLFTPAESSAASIVLLILSIVLLFGALKFMVDTLKAVMVGRIERLIHGAFFKTTVRALAFGLFVTVCVQSSSITTSMIVPLVAGGIITLQQAFPYTVGANIGTTVTALIAALSLQNPTAIALALTHSLFNVGGAAIFIPLRMIPIRIATWLGRVVIGFRPLAFVFIVLVFYVFPLAVIYFFG